MRYYQLLVLLLILLLASCGDQEIEGPGSQPEIGQNIGLINDQHQGVPLLVYANGKSGMFAAYERKHPIETHELLFTLASNSFPDIFKDQDGNLWNVFGQGVSPSVEGLQLNKVDHLVGYYFIFPAFYSSLQFMGSTGAARYPSALQTGKEWLVNEQYLAIGSFRDGIQSIDVPRFIGTTGKNLIDDGFYGPLDKKELVSVFRFDGITRIYPHRILQSHEVVNDQIGDLHFALSYCPLTGTSRVWSREIKNKIVSFGVSGILFNNNLVLFDRSSESNWSQVLNRAIHGPYIEQPSTTFNVLEMTLQDALLLDGKLELLDPDPLWLSRYGQSSYDDYKVSESIIFPISARENSLPAKERVLGVTIQDETKIYRFSDF